MVVEAIIQVIGEPVNEIQENIAYAGSFILLIVLFWSLFKIINYIFHI